MILGHCGLVGGMLFARIFLCRCVTHGLAPLMGSHQPWASHSLCFMHPRLQAMSFNTTVQLRVSGRMQAHLPRSRSRSSATVAPRRLQEAASHPARPSSLRQHSEHQGFWTERPPDFREFRIPQHRGRPHRPDPRPECNNQRGKDPGGQRHVRALTAVTRRRSRALDGPGARESIPVARRVPALNQGAQWEMCVDDVSAVAAPSGHPLTCCQRS